jgi:hypothetical protein
MFEAFTAILGALFTVTASYMAGMLVIKGLRISLTRQAQLPLAFVLGASCLQLVIFGILALKICSWIVLVSVLAAIVAAAIHRDAWQLRGPSVPPLGAVLKIGFASIFSVYTVLYFLHAWSPEASPDGSGYHLGFVARYLRAGGFEKITTNMYAGLSAGVDLLYVPAFAIGAHSAAALVHFSFTVALAIMIFTYGRRIGKPWAGALASLLVYLSPVVGIDGSSAYNDVAVAAIAFSVFYWLQLWDKGQEERLLIPIGLLAGYCYAAKYTAFVMVPYAVGYVAWRSRKMRPVLIVAGCAILMIAPWMTKDWIYLENPIAPFGNAMFRNPNMHVSVEKEWSTQLRSYGIPNRWTLPIEITVRGEKTNGMIGPIFWAAPLALLALRTRDGRRLLVPAFLLLVVYFGNIGARFLIPCLPFLSLAMALALPDAAPLLAAVAIFNAIVSWPPVISRYAAPYCWHIEGFEIKEALRVVSQDRYLRERNAGYGIARMVEENVPAGSPVMSTNGISDAYTSHEILVPFQAAFNENLYDIFSMGANPTLQLTRVRTLRFRPSAMRGIRIVQTGVAAGGEFWSVHELRFLRNDIELARSVNWHAYAFPNPWEVQLAFDNSPVTRWRSWEAASPGMYIAVDFGRVETVDEVQIETSSDTRKMTFEVDLLDEKRQWVRIPATITDSEAVPSASTRRAATLKLHEYGVDYLVVWDADPVGKEIHENPISWGVAEIAQGYGARLYKIIP